MKKLIISRHPAAIEFVRAECPDFADATVLASATPEDVRGADVVGNLPLQLVALCGRYRAVEFDGQPPRGAEYGVEEMRAAGARIQDYVVLQTSRAVLVESIYQNGLDIFSLRALFPQAK